MGTWAWVATIAAGWLVISIPVALFLGRVMRMNTVIVDDDTDGLAEVFELERGL